MCCLDDPDASAAASFDDASQSRRTQSTQYTQKSRLDSNSQPIHDSFSQQRVSQDSVSTQGAPQSPSMKRDGQSLRGDSLGVGSANHLLLDSEDDDSEGDADAEREMTSATASLFGSVVRNIGGQTERPRRATRRRRLQSPARGIEGHGSDRSRDLLADSCDDGDNDDEMQQLDVSTRRAAYEVQDRGNTSSPELVYGKEY